MGTPCQCGHVPSREVTGILPWAEDLDLFFLRKWRSGLGRPRPLGPAKWKWSLMLQINTLDQTDHRSYLDHFGFL